MQAYPNRILGAASANLLAPMEAVRELRRAVKTLGFRAHCVWCASSSESARRCASGRFAIIVLAIPAAGVMALVAGHYCGLWRFSEDDDPDGRTNSALRPVNEGQYLGSRPGK